MNAVNTAASEDALRGLMGTAFTAGEPGLPDVDDVMATVEFLGQRIRHRQRVRTGIAAGALCVAALGMVTGIAAIAHSTHSGGPTIVVPGGSVGTVAPPESSVPPAGDTDPASSGDTTSSAP